jgi:ribosomal protein S18 acetylase RimI-like enzyme
MTADRFSIRPFEGDDLQALYDICLRTAASGEDGTGLYADDPRAVGNLYAAPYAVREPELTFVLEDETGVCGYVLGAIDTAAFNAWLDTEWLPPLRRAHPWPEGEAASLTPSQRLYRRFHQPDLVIPAALEPYPAHLHIDLLPRAQGGGNGTRLMQHFLAELARRGSPGVHLGLGIRNERAFAFYRKLGFQELFRAGEPPHSIWMGLAFPAAESP